MPGRTIYDGPIEADEIYGSRDELSGITLRCDDFQGYCFGYNIGTAHYGEVSGDGPWEPWPASEAMFVTLPIPY